MKFDIASVKEATIIKYNQLIKQYSFDITIDWSKTIKDKSGNRKIFINCNIDGNSFYRNLSDIAAGKYECSECTFRRWSELSREKGYVCISREGSQHLLLQCHCCNLNSIVSISRILGSNRIVCKNCTEKEYSNTCIKLGVNYESNNGKSNPCITFRCLSCSSVCSKLWSNLRYCATSASLCTTCFSTKLKQNALLKGWIVTAENKGSKHEISCIKCNSTRTVSTNSLNSVSGLSCSTCKTNAYKNSLSQKDCVFIAVDKSDIRSKIKYKTKSGEIRVADTSYVTRGSFKVHDCINHWDVPYEVYLITAYYKNSIYNKIGIAQYTQCRVSQLNISCTHTFEILTKESNRYSATEIEKFLHSHYRSKAISKEIVGEFSTGRIIRENGSVVIDGGTEWFSELSMDCILNTLSEAKIKNKFSKDV